MTELRKICPNSGKSCDCPKGICNGKGMSDNEAAEMLKQPNEFVTDIIDSLFGEGLIEENDAGAQSDTLEAHSLKYQACAQIMQLSSGRFALFGAYRAGGGSGIELLAIGEWRELESHVCAYKELADAAYARGQERTLPAKIAADYDNLFGEES